MKCLLDLVLVLLLAACLIGGQFALAAPPDDDVTFSYVLTKAEHATIAEALGPDTKPEDWLAAQVAALVQQCRGVCKERRLAKFGIKAAGLTDAEVEAILAPREAKAAEEAAAAVKATGPSATSGTATPK